MHSRVVHVSRVFLEVSQEDIGHEVQFPAHFTWHPIASSTLFSILPSLAFPLYPNKVYTLTLPYTFQWHKKENTTTQLYDI